MENLERKHVHLFIRIERKQSHTQKKGGMNKKVIHKKEEENQLNMCIFFHFLQLQPVSKGKEKKRRGESAKATVKSSIYRNINARS